MTKGKPTAMERTQEYVDGVIDGSVLAPPFVKRSVERWKKAAETWERDVEGFNKHAAIIELLPIPQGQPVPITLHPWQCYVLSWLFLFQNERGARAIRELFLVVPRKAGKSTLLGAAALASMVRPTGGYQGQLILCFGVTDETARMTFDKARYTLMSDESNFDKRFCRQYGIKITQNRLWCGKTRSRIEPLTAGAKNLEGYTAEMVVADEISQMPTTHQMNIMRSGFGMAFSPQFVMTSTPGDLPVSAYDIELERAMRWLGMKKDGSDAEDPPVDDPTYAAMVYAATENDDPGDEAVWERTQPSYRYMDTMKEHYQSQWRAAQYDERVMMEFKTKQLCIPVKTEGSWITLEDWLATDDPPKEPRKEAGFLTFVGIDLSDVRDMTAICILQANPSTNEQRVWFEFHYPRGSLPTSLAKKPGDKGYIESDALIWAKQGLMEIHDGRVIDHERVAGRLTEINRDLQPLTFFSDNFSALEEVKRHVSDAVLAKSHLFPKSRPKHNNPIAIFSTWALNKSVAIQKHPIAEKHFRNAVPTTNAAGEGQMLEKPHKDSPLKIDAMDAMITAVAAWMMSQDRSLLGQDIAPHPGTRESLDYGFKVLG